MAAALTINTCLDWNTKQPWRTQLLPCSSLLSRGFRSLALGFHAGESSTKNRQPLEGLVRGAVNRDRNFAQDTRVVDLNHEGLERYFVTCAPGLEEVVAAELRSDVIRASRVLVSSAGVSFCGTKSCGIRANLWLRSAIRVLIELAYAPLSRGRIVDPVYEFVRDAADWPSILVADTSMPSLGYTGSRTSEKSYSRELHHRRKDLRASGGKARVTSKQSWNFRTFSVKCRVWDCEYVSNSLFASVRAKDAICDAVRDACGGWRPDPPVEGDASADVPLFLSLYKDSAVLYRDMSGCSLHKRGYRDVMHRAGLNEAVAAGVLTISGWNPQISEFSGSRKGTQSVSPVLMDPMCGSGTFLIEAALMATNSAPGLFRSHWPFETWHDFHPELHKSIEAEALAAEVIAPHGLRFLGNDLHSGALSLCERDAKAARVSHMLELSCEDCRDYCPPICPSVVVVNPPWGSRLGESSFEMLKNIAKKVAWRSFLGRGCSARLSANISLAE